MRFDDDRVPYRIGYHIHPVNASGNYLPEGGMFGDMDVYADTTPVDDSVEAQHEALMKAHEIAERFLTDPRAAVVYIRESHQMAPGQSWKPGPGVSRLAREAAQ